MRAMLARLIAVLVLAFAPALGLADERAMIGVGGTNTPFSAASTTYYLPIGAVGGPVLTNETLASTTWRGAGVISKIRIKPTTNARTSDTTVCLRIAGVDAVCKTIVALGPQEVTDLATDYPVNDGDAVVVKLTTGTGSGNLVLRAITMEFRTTSGQVFTHTSAAGSAALAVSRAFSSSGSLKEAGDSTLDTGGEAVALETATFSRLTVGVAANAASSATYNSRKNGANAGQSVTIASGAGPAVAEDSTNSDSLAAGNTYSVRLVAPGASVTTARVGYRYQGATPGRVAITSAGSANTLTAGNTYYGGPFSSATIAIAASSAMTEAVVPFDAHVSKLTAVVGSYAGTANVSIELLKNGASFSPPYTITFNAASGTVSEDVAGTSVAFAAGDRMNWKVSGQDGNLILRWVGFLMTDDNAGVAPPAAAVKRLMTLGVGR